MENYLPLPMKLNPRRARLSGAKTGILLGTALVAGDMFK